MARRREIPAVPRAIPSPASLPVAAGLAAAIVAVVMVLPAGDPVLPGVFLIACVLGAVFVRTGFGFTAGHRAFLLHGDGRALAASLLVPAVAVLLIVPLAAMWPAHQRWVTPIGAPLLLGAFVFGIGMQLAGGCGSGTLAAAGAGSRRMLVALPFFCMGGVLGSLVLPAALAWPAADGIDLVAAFGPAGAIVLSLALLGALFLLLARHGWPTRALLGPPLLIGLLAGAMFLVSGQPWGITMGLTLAGAQALGMLGVDLSRQTFWTWDGTAQALHAPLLSHHSALADLGLLAGAFAAAAMSGRLGILVRDALDPPG
jgi:hypothetical protein